MNHNLEKIVPPALSNNESELELRPSLAQEEKAQKEAETAQITSLLDKITQPEIALPESLRTHPLIQKGFLEIAWENEANPELPSEYFIGTLCGSPALSEAIERGELDQFFEDFTLLFREIYGGYPWHEYLVCSDPDCQTKVGINEAYNLDPRAYVPLADLEAQNPLESTTHTCPKCRQEMEPFYDLEKLKEQLRKETDCDSIISLLMDSEGKFLGFSHGWFTTLKQGWLDKLAPVFGTEITYDDYLQKIQPLTKVKNPQKDKILYWSDWAVLPPGRLHNAPLKTIENLVRVAAQKEGPDLHAIGFSKDGIRAHTVYESIGIKSLPLKLSTGEVIMATSIAENLKHF